MHCGTVLNADPCVAGSETVTKSPYGIKNLKSNKPLKRAKCIFSRELCFSIYVSVNRIFWRVLL